MAAKVDSLFKADSLFHSSSTSKVDHSSTSKVDHSSTSKVDYSSTSDAKERVPDDDGPVMVNAANTSAKSTFNILSKSMDIYGNYCRF